MIDVSASGHYTGDCRELLAQLPERCVQTCVTSPPYYGLRDYGHDGQIGLERTPDEYISALVEVFRGVRRALRNDGTLWVNIGDSYAREGGEHGRGNHLLHMEGKQKRMCKPTAGLKHKDLIGIPWMLAFALRADGWYLRQDIIWHKPNPMPESVTDRCTKAHEYIFLLSKSERYHYDVESIRQALAKKTATSFGSSRRSKGNDALGKVAADNWSKDVPVRKPRLGPDGKPAGANLRSVWTVATQPYSGAHFAVFPPRLIEPCILAGSKPGDIVLDPFFGSGTTGLVALQHQRRYIGFDLGYHDLATERLRTPMLPMKGVA